MIKISKRQISTICRRKKPTKHKQTKQNKKTNKTKLGPTKHFINLSFMSATIWNPQQWMQHPFMKGTFLFIDNEINSI